MIGKIPSIVRFVVVGGAGALAFVAMATFLTWLGMQVWLAGALSYLVLVPPIYLAQHRVTFSSTTQHRHSLPRYAVVQVIGFMLAWALPLLTDRILPPPACFFLVAVCGALLSFALQKLWVFDQTDMKQV